MWSAYADDDPDHPAEVSGGAEPGLAPPPPLGLDPIELVVDGETWVVSRRADAPRSRDFDWVSHPHGYGFAVGSNTDRQPTADELVETIRAFMAEVDPATGYLPD